MLPKTTPQYNLQVIKPALAAEWHFKKNRPLIPLDITPNSGRKVWWRCKRGHEWITSIDNRSKGSGCSQCCGRKASPEINFSVSFPELAKEWHPSKNGFITPQDVTKGSARNVWWLCCKGHEWQAKPYKRAAGHNCPYCSGRRVNSDNSLEARFPAIAAQWCFSKNGSLTPQNVTNSSNRMVWWQCEKAHQWRVRIHSRTLQQTGCPYCSGRRVCLDNCLRTINPILASEWHPTRNHNFSSCDVTPGSQRKVWWQCKREHEWQAAVCDRSNGNGCPQCNSKTSRLELRILSEIKKIFCNAGHRWKANGIECDVYIPDLKMAIEIDGFFWHKDKLQKEIMKEEKLKKIGITLLRVREQGLAQISNTDIFFSNKTKEIEIMRQIARNIITMPALDPSIRQGLEQYIQAGEFINEIEFESLLALLPGPLPGQSLFDKNQSLAGQWHPAKNRLLATKDVSVGSQRKVWWLCEKGHEWEASLYNRQKGKGCPYCANRKINHGNCLATLNPEIARQWHPTKNGLLTSRDVGSGSHKKIWWFCEKGHERLESVYERIKRDRCMDCTSLHEINPDLAKEWHPTRNGSLAPLNVTFSSGRKVWWLCANGHDWKASVDNRSRGNGCPYCSGRNATKQTSLSAKYPELAQEWHPTKNGSLTPIDVTPGSDKKIWWVCKKGHEWPSIVSNRSHGKGCPYCVGRRANHENCLATQNPEVAAQWHPTKNGSLTPDDVVAGSTKNIWWACLNGHEWEARVRNRRGVDCPQCRRMKN